MNQSAFLTLSLAQPLTGADWLVEAVKQPPRLSGRHLVGLQKMLLNECLSVIESADGGAGLSQWEPLS